MSVVVIRSRKKDAELDQTNPLHRMQLAIDWPQDAVSASRNHRSEPWQFTTKSDILRQRRERMERCLWWKREYRVLQRKCAYVWVFWCPGINNFIYRGWWLYLIGVGFEGGKYLEQNTRMVARIMELFQLVKPMLFGSPDIKKWKSEFVKQFPRGSWCGKPQGKAPVWVEVQDNSINRILSRAEWPKERKK